MKLSVETWVIQDAVGYENAIRMIAEAGFDCCDMSYFGETVERDLLGEDYLQKAETLRRWMNEAGISCNQAHAPFTFSREDVLGETNPRWVQTARAIRSAAFLGADQIIVHAVGDERDRDFTEFNLDFYRSFAPVCADAGIRVAVENLFIRDTKRRCIVGRLGTPEKLMAFMKQLDPRYFTACVDLGHAAITGQEPEEFLAGMDGDVLGALHVHDNNYLDDCHWLPWIGDFHWDEIVKTLARIGYRGDMTLEALNYFVRYDAAMLPRALKFAEVTGRELIKRFEQACRSDLA